VPRHARDGRISQSPGGVLRVPRSAEPLRSGTPSTLDGITLNWEFDTDLFEDVFGDHMAAAYGFLLRSLAEAPGAPVSRLALVDERVDNLVRDWGEGRRVDPPSPWVPDLVARWVRDTPGATAVAGPHPLSYAELDARSGHLARHLRSLGTRRGDIVAVRVPHGPELAVALLGVLRSGAAYLPCDPADPPARTTALMAACEATTVVTVASSAGATPLGFRVVVMEEVPVTDGALPAGAGTDACYVIHTSGSTGTPKGVVVEHRSRAARLVDDGITALAPGDRLLAAGSPAFDLAVLELWGPLTAGASVRLLERPWDIAGLVRELRSPATTHAFLSTGLLHEVLTAAPDAPAGLRCLVAGGDVLAPGVASALLSSGVERAWYAYGPTETTVVVTAMPLEAWAAGPDEARIPIGRPLPNATVQVLDAHGLPVPPGAVGEICVSGPLVARGYTGATGGSDHGGFVPRPDGAGLLYRTGDLGRWLDGGLLEFRGRSDRQVKIRGYRVEPAEVRAGLLALPGVRDAVVTVDRSGGRLIAHALTGRSGEDIRRELAQLLPRQLVPAVVVPHERFPTTDGGKVDAAALRAAPVSVRPRPAAPRSPLEERVTALVADHLGAVPGPDDDLFALGLDSLRALGLVHRLSTGTGRLIGLDAVLAAPTVTGLVAALESAPTGQDSIRRVAR
ncbi:amino acid adenylation domain-containing protein, partial [Streptomyces sp. NPDC058955]|uniref:amino acid adenylation domain-containing protein n=1 Tax=Streptomyces sp. NPDC058955 TaxID=3346678 RepID=UPI0036A77C15